MLKYALTKVAYRLCKCLITFWHLQLATLTKTSIDPLAILQKSLDGAMFFYKILYARLDRVALELRSQLYTFENSTQCNQISFDPYSFSE